MSLTSSTNLKKFITFNVFNLRVGFGTREHDYPPYRAVGPVTVEEYESRSDRYDKQLREIVGGEISQLSTAEKIALLRESREDQYNQLLDAVYERRGWTQNGIPTPEKLAALGIDLPEVLEVVRSAAAARTQ